MNSHLLNNLLPTIVDMLVVFWFIFSYFIKKFKDINDVLDKDNRKSFPLLCSFLIGLIIATLVINYIGYIDIKNKYILTILYVGILILFYILFPLTLFTMFSIVLSARRELNMYYQEKESWFDDRSSLLSLIIFYFIATPLSIINIEMFRVFYFCAFISLLFSLNGTKNRLLKRKLFYHF